MTEKNNNSLIEEKEEGDEDEDEVEVFTPKFVSCSPIRLRKRPIPAITSDHSENSIHCRKKTRELPNISNCHSCGLRFPDKGRSESLQPLRSQWRVVFLCSGCLRGIRSAKVCSYCFSSFGESESGGFIDCRRCSCRVHFACIPKQRGYVVPLDHDPNSFVCVDCCALPKYFSVKRGSCSNRDSNDDNFGSCHLVEMTKDVSMVDLDGMVRDATSVVLKKKVVASKARVKALDKALAANHAAELARKALNLSVLASKGLDDVVKSDAVNDQELALRLHKAMNGSQRNLRNHYSSNPMRLFDLKSEIHNSDRRDIQMCVENRSPDNVGSSDSEPLIQACLRYCGGASSLSSPVRLLDLKREIRDHSQIDTQSCVENSCPDNVGSSDSEPSSQACFQYYSGDLRKDSSDQSKHSTKDMPVKVGDSSCLEKIENLHKGEDSDGSVSASCQRFDGTSGDLGLLRCDSRGDGGEDFTSTQAKETHDKSPDRYLFKYYCKRNCKLRSTVNNKGSIRSTSMLPQIHVRCSDDSGTYSDSACEAQMVTMHISAIPNGLSGCRS